MQALTEDGVLGLDFSDGVGVDDVGPGGKSFSEGNLSVGGAGFEIEVLVAEGSRATDGVYGYDDDGEIEIVLGTIRDLNGAVDAVAVDHWETEPVEQECGADQGAETFADGVRGMAGIFDRDRERERARFGGAAGQESLWRENNSLRRIVRRGAPEIGRNASSGVEGDVNVNSGRERGQIVVQNGEWLRSLGGEEAAQTEHRDSQNANGLSQDDPYSNHAQWV